MILMFKWAPSEPDGLPDLPRADHPVVPRIGELVTLLDCELEGLGSNVYLQVEQVHYPMQPSHRTSDVAAAVFVRRAYPDVFPLS